VLAIVGARSPSVDNDRIRGKGSGSDGTGSVVEPVGGADTIEGRSLEMKRSPGERKQNNTKVSFDKDHNY
jgi:hypothetical protein